MRLRAMISIDIDAADFVEAAQHQRTMETILNEVRAKYDAAVLDFRERRGRSERSATSAAGARTPPERLMPRTGRLHAYVD